MRGVFRGGSGGTPMADPAVLKQLPPLPGTRVELTAMAAALRAPAGAVRLDMAATETAVHADKSLGQARVVAFATHGLLPDEIRGVVEPGLVLTPPAVPSALDDGVLTASEAAALELSADWVVLSACNTATADSSADSLSSLSRAFLYAGARALLASHWRVSDEATAVLTVETQREDATQTRAVALQSAMRAVRTGKRSDGSTVAGWTPDWVHPMMWAPFSLISTADE
jgi:CHAT domain-containing protein